MSTSYKALYLSSIDEVKKIKSEANKYKAIYELCRVHIRNLEGIIKDQSAHIANYSGKAASLDQLREDYKQVVIMLDEELMKHRFETKTKLY